VDIPGYQGHKVLIHADKFYFYFLRDLYPGMNCRNLGKLVLTTYLKPLFTSTKIDLLKLFLFYRTARLAAHNSSTAEACYTLAAFQAFSRIKWFRST